MMGLDTFLRRNGSPLMRQNDTEETRLLNSELSRQPKNMDML